MTTRGLKTDLEDLLKKPERKCNIAVALESVSKEEREILQKLLDSPVSPTRLAAVLKSHGHAASHSTVYKHRNKVCICIT
jgi:hypothetical protein